MVSLDFPLVYSLAGCKTTVVVILKCFVGFLLSFAGLLKV